MTNICNDKKVNTELNQLVELDTLEPVADMKTRRYVITAKFSE